MSGVLMEDTSQNATSSAPESGAAAPADTGASRPTSASAAMEGAAARSAAQPAPASGVKPDGQAGGTGKPAGPVAPTAQPAKPAIGQPQAKGPIPFDAHETALKNARTKAREEAMQQFAWANGVDPAVAQRALSLAKRLDTDPRAFAKQLQAELAESQPDDKFPDPDFKTADGKMFYSAQSIQKIADQIRAGVMREVNGQLQPVLDERAQAEENRQKAERLEFAKSEGRKVVSEGLAHARTLPHFKEHEKEISAKLDEITPETRTKVGLVGAMYMAYSAVLIDLINAARTQGEQSTLTDLRRRANAGTGNASPGGPVAPASKKKPSNPQELAAHMERLSQSLTAQ